MKLSKGNFIQSTAALNDTIFANVTIYITEHNADGAVGFVVTKPFGRSLQELEEFKHSRDFLLYEGGPVDKEHLFFIHRRPDLIKEGTIITGNVYSGGNFRQAVDGINTGSLSSSDIKVFVGYCGWDAGELEAEITEGSWLLVYGAEDSLFSANSH